MSEVITFYSYTGGAGRSTALANVGCLLASRCAEDRGVLMIDWHLEAPSLHRFFPAGAGDRPGLLDLFVALDSRIPLAGMDGAALAALLADVDPGRFIFQTQIPSLSLLQAGRFDGDYSATVSGFRWAALHEQAPLLIGFLMEWLRKRYQFILIDSASGVNDMSGLCAMMLPDKLVAAFTPSRQSVLGILDVVRCALDYRKDSDGGQPLAIFPLPCKIETSEPGLRYAWRHGAENGYQARFEALFGPLDEYFGDVQIPYIPRYSYGDEAIAAAPQSSGGRALLSAYQNLADRLQHTASPADTRRQDAASDTIAIGGRMMSLATAGQQCLLDIERHKASRDENGTAAALELLAEIYERQGKLDEAAATYLDAIAVYRDGTGPGLASAGMANAAAGVARVRLSMGQIGESRIYYLNAVKLYRDASCGAALASTLSKLGDVDLLAEEFGAALEHFAEAAAKFRELGDNEAAGHTLVSLAAVEEKTGDVAAAREHYSQGSQLCQQERDISAWASALMGLAGIDRRVGKLEDAEENYAGAARLLRGEGDGVRLGHALRGLADVRLARKNIGQASQDYREALDLFRRHDNSAGVAAAAQSLAELESRRGNHEEAERLFVDAAERYRKANSPLGVAGALLRAGDLDRLLGRYDWARSHYEQSMELYRAQSANLGVANCLHSMGNLEKRLGRLFEAEQRYKQAIQLFHVEGPGVGMANTFKGLGDLETETGNLRLARDHYEQAIEMYRCAGNTLGLANALQGLGDVAKIDKRYGEAARHYLSARDLYRNDGHLAGLAYTCGELARVSHATFDFTASIDYLRQASAAATESNAPPVMEFVRGIGRELMAGSARAAAV